MLNVQNLILAETLAWKENLHFFLFIAIALLIFFMAAQLIILLVFSIFYPTQYSVKKYKTEIPCRLGWFRRFGLIGNNNRVLMKFAAERQGLYIGSSWATGLFIKPLLILWDEVSFCEEDIMFGTRYYLVFAAQPNAKYVISRRIQKWILNQLEQIDPENELLKSYYL